MRILVVEDDLEAQRYLVNGLKEAGHVVDDAGDGDIGLTLALSRPYDVAIIDRMLPKVDGLKLVEEIREHGNVTPVLFLSALSEVDPRKAQVVELRFFGGLTAEETAEVLKISPESVLRDWRLAKSWLLREIKKGAGRGA